MKRLFVFLAAIAAFGLQSGRAGDNDQTIKMSEQSEWLSLTSEYNLFFNTSYTAGTKPDGSSCFAFIAVAADADCVYLKHVSIVKAGTPIWIWGVKKTDYTSKVTTFNKLSDLYPIEPDEYDDVEGNLLVGSTTETTTIIDGDYFLSSKDNFVHSATATGMTGKQLPAGKALLRTGSTSHANLRFAFIDDNDEAEAIQGIEYTAQGGSPTMYDPGQPSYNTAGQLIPADAHGLHIQNGKKFYIK
jgi:hypothetical protein